MKTYRITSAQTGMHWEDIQASSKDAALHIFAVHQGFKSERAMFDSGRINVHCEEVQL